MRDPGSLARVAVCARRGARDHLEHGAGNLYQDGLQRARFLTAIALLQRSGAVRQITSPTRYRLRSLTSADFPSALGPQSDAQIEACYVR